MTDPDTREPENDDRRHASGAVIVWMVVALGWVIGASLYALADYLIRTL